MRFICVLGIGLFVLGIRSTKDRHVALVSRCADIAAKQPTLETKKTAFELCKKSDGRLP